MLSRHSPIVAKKKNTLDYFLRLDWMFFDIRQLVFLYSSSKNKKSFFSFKTLEFGLVGTVCVFRKLRIRNCK